MIVGAGGNITLQVGKDGVRTIDVPRMAVLDTMGAVVVVEIDGDTVQL